MMPVVALYRSSGTDPRWRDDSAPRSLPLSWRWAAVSGWVGFGSDGSSVGVGHQVAAVVEALQRPVAFVEHGVVRRAGEGAVVDDGRASACPCVQVVRVGPGDRSVAVGDGAAVAVAGDHRDPLGGGEEPALAA